LPNENSQKETGRERLLKAASTLLADRPASAISTRLLAKQAGVHHTLASYTHGGVAELLTAAFKVEEANFAQALPSIVFESPNPFPLSTFPNYWRSYIYQALDGRGSASEHIRSPDHMVARVAVTLHSRFPDRNPATNDLLAIVWWVLQIGALVFDEPFCRGLSVARRDRDKVRRFASEMLTQLLREAPDPLPRHAIADEPARKTASGLATGRKAAEARLVHAAIEILKERAEEGVSGRELARRANANYGLIHHYFGSKEAVFDAAFVQLHDRYVQDMVPADTQQLAAPFSMRNHEVFLRIWAYRELAKIAMPAVDLKGMRLLVDNIVQRRRIGQRAGQDYIAVQASAYCSLALQLGWVVCRQDLRGLIVEDETDTLTQLASVARWFVTRNWR
jgi:AcrR family transcriptional regulator